jgi:hypothetical protein
MSHYLEKMVMGIYGTMKTGQEVGIVEKEDKEIAGEGS